MARKSSLRWPGPGTRAEHHGAPWQVPFESRHGAHPSLAHGGVRAWQCRLSLVAAYARGGIAARLRATMTCGQGRAPLLVCGNVHALAVLGPHRLGAICNFTRFRSLIPHRLGAICNFTRFRSLRPCLISHPKFFRPSHRIFRHIHGTLNIHKKIN